MDDSIKNNSRRAELKPGGFVHLQSEFSDVWHQVDKVYDEYITIACENNFGEPTSLKAKRYVTDFIEDPPSNARIIYYANGMRFLKPSPYKDRDGFKRWKSEKDRSKFLHRYTD